MGLSGTRDFSIFFVRDRSGRAFSPFYRDAAAPGAQFSSWACWEFCGRSMIFQSYLTSREALEVHRVMEGSRAEVSDHPRLQSFDASS